MTIIIVIIVVVIYNNIIDIIRECEAYDRNKLSLEEVLELSLSSELFKSIHPKIPLVETN